MTEETVVPETEVPVFTIMTSLVPVVVRVPVVAVAAPLVPLAVPSSASAPPEPTLTELDAPSVNVSPRVSVGVEGGLWPYHPRPYTDVFPAVTDEEYASPHEEELQFAA